MTDDSATAGNLISGSVLLVLTHPCLQIFIISRTVTSQTPRLLLTLSSTVVVPFTQRRSLLWIPQFCPFEQTFRNMTVCNVLPKIYHPGLFFWFIFQSQAACVALKTDKPTPGAGINQYIQLGSLLGGKFISFSTYQVSSWKIEQKEKFPKLTSNLWA